MRRLAGIALIALLAGCLQVGTPPQEPAASPDDGRTTLQVAVVDSATGAGLPDAQAALTIPARGTVRKATDDDGRVTFTIDPAPACSLTVDRAGFQGGAVSLDCRQDGTFRVPLKAGSSGAGGPRPTLPLQPGSTSSAPPAGSVILQGLVLDLATGAPVSGATVRLDPPSGQAMRTGGDGAYAFAVLPGRHILAAEAPCRVPAEFPLDIEEDTVLDLQLAVGSAPSDVPGGVRATSGPGPGMVTVSWADVAGAQGFLLLRGGQPLVQLGHSLAYGIPGAAQGDRFAVAATDACGNAGPASGEVSATPLPGLGGLAASPVNVDVRVGEESYGVFRADGSVAPERRWRTVTGTGNCCENYIATTPSGRILDQGGSTIAYSDDEGVSWQGILSPFVLLAGEGSVAAAPDGDIVAFDWATYNADTAFAYRYSAATKSWSSQSVAKAPAYDRPWIATIKGPFEINGLVVPYVSVVEGGIGLKDPLLVSFDGLHYVPSNSLATLGGASVDLRSLLTKPDRNRDWIAPMAEFGVTPVDNGVGILELSAAMRGTPTWTGVQLPQIPGDVLRIDGAGNLHAVSVDGGSLRYAISHDGGAHWQSQTFHLPSGWTAGEWDFRANAELDQAVFAVNADSGSNVKQAALRFRGLAGTPYLEETLLVGDGDGVFGSGVTETGNRFDFMTLGFLPDGRIVMSAADAAHANPFLAIELPRVP